MCLCVNCQASIERLIWISILIQNTGKLTWSQYNLQCKAYNIKPVVATWHFAHGRNLLVRCRRCMNRSMINSSRVWTTVNQIRTESDRHTLWLMSPPVPLCFSGYPGECYTTLLIYCSQCEMYMLYCAHLVDMHFYLSINPSRENDTPVLHVVCNYDCSVEWLTDVSAPVRSLVAVFVCVALPDSVRWDHLHLSPSLWGCVSTTWHPGPEPTYQHYVLCLRLVHAAAGRLWCQVRKKLQIETAGTVNTEAALCIRYTKL